MTTTLSFNDAKKTRVNFMTAAKKGHVKALAKALAAQPELAKRLDKNGWSALMWASRRGHAACVELLMPASDPLVMDWPGRSALILAATYGHTSCVELLLPASDPLAGGQLGKSALMMAARYSHTECVKLLLPVSNPRETDSLSALMYAAANGNAACVKLLLPASDPIAADFSGTTALMYAAWEGQVDCVELLLPVSDLSMANRSGETALDMARRLNRCEAVVAFERHQAKLEAAELSEHIGAALSALRHGCSESRRAARL